MRIPICVQSLIMNEWISQWQAVRQQITEIGQRHHRIPGDVNLLAVSKTFPAQAVVEVARAGQRHFGENYIQEGVDKIAQVAALAPDLAHELVWHCVGPIQSNKTRQVAAHFQWVHTIDRFKIAQRLNDQRPTHLPALNVLIQVNMDGGENKSGVAPSEALELARAISELPRLNLRGLMSIPEPQDDPLAMRKIHQATRDVLSELQAAMPHLTLDVLSMGMSADLEPAIAAGSTWVRVGTAIFGKRT